MRFCAADEDSLRHRVKAELRKRMRALRKTAPSASCLDRSLSIVERLQQHDAFNTARSVALFWPIEAKHEVDLKPFDTFLRDRKIRVAYPAIDQDTGTMAFRFVDTDPRKDATALTEQGLGFSEPSAACPMAASDDLSVIVVPALAFDSEGQRLGYGAGYYDRTLALFPTATTIGVAYDYQLVPELPVTEGDIPVQWIVTDKRTLKIGP